MRPARWIILRVFLLVTERPLKYNPYSGGLWTYFAPILRKIASQTFKSIAFLSFEVCRKALILAHRMAVQTSQSDRMRPISGILKCRGWPEIEFEISKSWQKNILFSQLGFFKRDEISLKKLNADVWPTVGCARIRAFQRRSNYWCTATCEVVAPHFWKQNEMLEFWAK